MTGSRKIENLIFILTSRCNSRCSYCYQTARDGRRMDWRTLQASIDFALGLESNEIELIFLGGEPLLAWNRLRKAVEYAERHAPPPKRLSYALTTNGLLITDEIAAFLDKHKIHTRISFDGLAEMQDYRKKGSFATMDRMLERLRLETPDLFRHRLRICMTLMPSTIPYLADSVAYFINKCVQDIAIAPCLTPCPGWTRERISELEAQVLSIYDLSRRHFSEVNRVPVAFLRREKHKARNRNRARAMCGVIDGADLLIDVDGQAYGCVLFTESYQKYRSDFLAKRMRALRLGNFLGPDFWERYAALPNAARKAELFHHKEKKHSGYGKCKGCTYLDECAVCPVSIGYDPNNLDPHRVPDFLCAFNRVTLKYRRRFPVMPDPNASLKRLLGLRS